MTDFDLFWNAYPRHVGKKRAAQIWHRDKPDLKTVLSALRWQDQLPQWYDRQYVPHPATYLHQQRYLDEPPDWASPPIPKTDPASQDRLERYRTWFTDCTHDPSCPHFDAHDARCAADERARKGILPM